MRPNIVGTICFSAVLVLGLAAVASADDVRTCSSTGVAGEWGYTKTGTVILPTGAIPFASVGRVSLDVDGNLSGTNYSSSGGQVGKGEIRGTITVNPDCTGMMTGGLYDQSGNLLRALDMALVFDDNARELRMMVTSLALPNGMSLPSVIAGQGRKLFPKGGDEQ